MGGGLAFLTKKSFNPANISNQKNVWEAKQRKDIEAAKNKERQLQLQRERDHEELERARGGDGQGDRAALRFMYEVPPGLESSKAEDDQDDENDVMNTKKASTDESKDNSDVIGADFLRRQDGDDEAAAMFRQIFSASADAMPDHQEEDNKATAEYGTSVVLSGSTLEVDQTNNNNGVDSRTQLEKAAGIRNRLGNTLEEQVARFPQLKNAPMAKGLKTDEVNVKFNPLGAQIRNVRCLKCGVWGHSRGDRECKLSGWNPFENYGPKTATPNDVNTARFNNVSVEKSTSKRQDESIGMNDNTSRNIDEKRSLSKSEKDSSNSDDDRRKRHSRKKHHRKRRSDERKHRRKRKKKSKRKYYSSSDDEYDSTSSDSYHKKRKKSHKKSLDEKRKRRRSDSHSIGP